MGIAQMIADLYLRGIDCGIESFYGVGLLAWVVDGHNRRIEKQFDIEELDSVGEWLASEAARQYDSSQPHAARELLAELSGSERKDAKRVTSRERHERNASSIQNGTHR